MSEFEFLTKYTGRIKINGQNVSRIRVMQALEDCDGEVTIDLIPENFVDLEQPEQVPEQKLYKVFVKNYMLEHSNPDFLFMKAWNNDIPMPMRVMVGTIENQTRSMYLMDLHGEPYKADVCIRCGRRIVNPVSKVVGVGPECCTALGIDVKLMDRSACEEYITRIEHKIKNIKWKGWVPKTAILTLEEYTDA